MTTHDNHLPSFEQVRSDALRLLGDVEDVLRSDLGGPAPNERQHGAMLEARRHIAAAKAALDEAARLGSRR